MEEKKERETMAPEEIKQILDRQKEELKIHEKSLARMISNKEMLVEEIEIIKKVTPLMAKGIKNVTFVKEYEKNDEFWKYQEQLQELANKRMLMEKEAMLEQLETAIKEKTRYVESHKEKLSKGDVRQF